MYDLFVDETGAARPATTPRDDSAGRRPSCWTPCAARPGPSGGSHADRASAAAGQGGRGRACDGRRGGARSAAGDRAEVIEPRPRRLLPAITFIFSRAGWTARAAAAAPACGSSRRKRATGSGARRGAAAAPPTRTSACRLLGVRRGSRPGFAAHHAGMLPTFRRDRRGAVRRGPDPGGFATETLALGINMPARTVVLEAGSSTARRASRSPRPIQLTGRAGRRGIHVEGHAVPAPPRRRPAGGRRAWRPRAPIR